MISCSISKLTIATGPRLGKIWHFHDQRQLRAFPPYAPDGGHVAAMETFFEAGAVDDRARSE